MKQISFLNSYMLNSYEKYSLKLVSDNILVRLEPDCSSDIVTSLKQDSEVSVLGKQKTNCSTCKIISNNVRAIVIDNDDRLTKRTVTLNANKCVKVLKNDRYYSHCEFVDIIGNISTKRKAGIPNDYLSDMDEQYWYKIKVESDNIDGWIKTEFIKLNN